MNFRVAWPCHLLLPSLSANKLSMLNVHPRAATIGLAVAVIVLLVVMSIPRSLATDIANHYRVRSLVGHGLLSTPDGS